MERRTHQERVNDALHDFLEKMGIVKLLTEFFEKESMQKCLHEGFVSYTEELNEAKEQAPDEIKEIAAQAADESAITEEVFAATVFETFEKRFAEIMMPVATYISIKDQLVELLQKQEDENLTLLLEGAIDEVMDLQMVIFANLGNMLLEGIPLEMARKLAAEAGEATIIPIGVELCRCDSEDDDEEEGEEPYHNDCNGECGSRCNCKNSRNCEKAERCLEED